MDVKLPDGTIIKNVPDGTTQAQLEATLASNGYDVAKLRAAPAAPSAAAPRQGRSLSDLIADRPAQAEPLSRTEKVGFGMFDPIAGGAQLLEKGLQKVAPGVLSAGNQFNNWLSDKTGLVARVPEGGVDQMTREREQDYQRRRAAQGESGFDAYRTVGNVASPANLAIASRLPAAASMLGRAGISGVSGAGMSALNPVTGGDDYWTSKRNQMAVGGGLGLAAPLVGAGLGRIISPNASKNAELAMLKSEGVEPTVGQALGGRWNALEEKAQSVPILGDAISLSRLRALTGFNKAAINRASGKVGEDVTEAGQEGVRQAGNAISKAYDTALGQISGVQLDNVFSGKLGQLRGMADGLTDSMKAKFNNAIDQTLMRKVSRNGSILPDDYKAIDSELGNLAARYGKSQVASEQELGDAVKQLQALLRDQMGRSNPKVADMLKQADEAWANLVRVEGAGRAGKNSADQLFTPGMLNTAIQGADKSVRKRAVSRGEALMQDLGNAGQQVLGNKVPNSFTTDRALIAGGGLAGYMVNPAIPATLLAGAAGYTAPVQRALVSAVSSRPAGAANLAQSLRGIDPALIAAIPGLQQYLTEQDANTQK
jgi:hypothetical protein